MGSNLTAVSSYSAPDSEPQRTIGNSMIVFCRHYSTVQYILESEDYENCFHFLHVYSVLVHCTRVHDDAVMTLPKLLVSFLKKGP